MKSFGRLLRRMRGREAVEKVAARAGVEAGLLAGIEAGRTVADEPTVQRVLRRGFGLDEGDAERLVLGLRLYDLGLKDSDFRQLAVDEIRGRVPARVRERVKRLYRGYAAGR